jgi:GTPase SAR1 family protein
VDDQRAEIDSKIKQLPKVLGSINEVKKELRQSKIMIVGEGCAGKTAFANSIIGKKFEETKSTVGIDTFRCSVTHAALSKSEWKKCEKIEKEYENAIAEHLSFMKKVDIEDDDLTQQESSQSVGNKDRNGLDTRMDVDHQGGEEDGIAFAHSKGDSTTNIDHSNNAKVDEDMIIKYVANHVEIGANILISIFDYGGQTVFNVSTMFIYITIIPSADNSVNHIIVFLDYSSIFLNQIRYICTRLQYGVDGE